MSRSYRGPCRHSIHPCPGSRDPGLVFEEYNLIRTLNPIVSDGFLWAEARPRGNVEKHALALWYAAALGGPYVRKSYLLSDYDYRDPEIQPPLPLTIPGAAKVISALDLGARSGQPGSWPQFAHLGANAYGRLTGLSTRFGSSLRLGAYDVGFADTKPRLTSLYVRPLAGHRFALFGVVESQPFTACVQSVVTPDLSTRIQTSMPLYPRLGYLGPPGAKVSPLALSSMFWKGEAQTPANPADEAHDADSLAVCGQGTADLQGLVPAPGTGAAVRDFGTAGCFRLMQTDRDPTHYEIYGSAAYARRVSLWVDHLESDLPFSVKLMAYGTEYEGDDNVVAYAELQEDPPAPSTAADGVNFSYTLTASALPPPESGPRIALGDAVPGDVVGRSVAMSEDILAMGAPGLSDRQGSVYLFRSTPYGLVADRRLTPDDGGPGDGFGASVTLSGETLVVGAPGRRAAYVFVRQGQDWVQQATLHAPEMPGWGDSYGAAVTVSGNTLAVGAPYDERGWLGSDEGSVYVYRRQGQVWNLEANLSASDAAPWDHFGFAVSLDGNNLAIGAPGDDYPQLWEQDSVYLFQRSGSAWAEIAKLTEGGGWKDYGAAVALRGARLLVGVPRAHGNGWRTSAGGVHAYARVDGAWVYKQWLRPTDWQNGDEFGTAVSFRGLLAVIGAPKALDGQGAAYLYPFAAGTWKQGGKLTGTPEAGGQFGTAVITDGVAQLIGAPPAVGQQADVQGDAYWYAAP